MLPKRLLGWSKHLDSITCEEGTALSIRGQLPDGRPTGSYRAMEFTEITALVPFSTPTPVYVNYS
jgi:hypothetical protein